MAATATGLIADMHGACLRHLCVAMDTDFCGLAVAGRAARRAQRVPPSTAKC